MAIRMKEPTTMRTSLDAFRSWLDKQDYSAVVVLTDHNTAEHCLPLLQAHRINHDFHHSIKPGESNKNWKTCLGLWKLLQKHNIDKYALLINLGGGMVCDLGGFCASVYKRGISFVHIPTSLLGMVDASVGGKTGIDFESYKNSIGSFAFPKCIVRDIRFLDTLPKIELRNGYAEMLKHALIADRDFFQQLTCRWSEKSKLLQHIETAVAIKQKFVQQDPYEHNIRKALNFGHTIGHAIESLHLGSEDEIAHGQAVAIGMICESIIAKQEGLLDEKQCLFIGQHIIKQFDPKAIHPSHFSKILDTCLKDKKNKKGQILMSLIGPVGEFHINKAIASKQIYQALTQYNELIQ